MSSAEPYIPPVHLVRLTDNLRQRLHSHVGFTAGWCAVAAAALCGHLTEANIRARLVFGSLIYDLENGMVLRDRHAWVESGEWLCDPTCDQYLADYGVSFDPVALRKGATAYREDETYWSEVVPAPISPTLQEAREYLQERSKVLGLDETDFLDCLNRALFDDTREAMSS